MIVEDPGICGISLEYELNIKVKIVFNSLYAHVRFESDASEKHHSMSVTTLKERNNRVARLLCKLKRSQGTQPLIFWSGKKGFWEDKKLTNELIGDCARMLKMYQFSC